MAFSGALTLTDLNDFITPSQACIKPVEQLNSRPQEQPGAASTEIRIDSSGTYYEVSSDLSSISQQNGTSPGKKLEQAQISLNDCLACSGCITSAESVLITLQSHTEVLSFLQANADPACAAPKVPVISVAPQTLASLAASLSSHSGARPIALRQVLCRVQAFCRDVLGFAHVFDTTFARHLALREHVREFEERRAHAADEGQLPMLASACPGWVCYAEKAHAEMLPFIARTKSPQQVMGTLVKAWMGAQWGKLPDEIYHVSVMPCYDKKLEASRQDFYNEVYSTRDVDCVLTTGELELIMREKGWDLYQPVPGELDPLPQSLIPALLSHPGTSSGSYLHALITHLTDTSPTPLSLTVRTIRNADYEEYTLCKGEGGSGDVVFKGAKCYGFRNLQNVVRKVGRERGVRVGGGAAGKLAGASHGIRARINARARKGGEGRSEDKERGYDYVEVMACPGGCVNGGGQLKPPTRTFSNTDSEGYKRDWEQSGVQVPRGDMEAGVLENAKWGDKEWTKKVEKAYWHDLPTPPASPTLTTAALPAGAEMESDRADRLAERIAVDFAADRGRYQMGDAVQMLRTNYRAVESEIVGLAVKW